MTEKYEYCSTVPRTFVQDCSYGLVKLTDLWITSLFFDLNNKFINGSFAFSPG